MPGRLIAALVVGGALLAPHAVQAGFSFGAGDLIWADGQQFTYDEYEEYKKHRPTDGSTERVKPLTPAQVQYLQQLYEQQRQQQLGQPATAAPVLLPAPQYQVVQPAPQYPATQPQYQVAQPQVQAPPTVTMVNGQPVITVAPPPVSAPLPIQQAVVPAAPLPTQPIYAAAPVLTPPPAAAPVLRSASCRTTQYYQEFPGENERFDCGPAGRLTRQEMASQGWKIDFVEKLPAASQPNASAYKIILSR